MSLSKTDNQLRNFTQLEKYPVYETLPAYFELEYPKFTEFLERYYEYLSDLDTTRNITDEVFIRDFVQIGPELLRFMSKELLLGRDYYDKFVDPQGAVQVSNLMYRSKGTHYAIQMFFRVFFGFDVDIRYGQDEVFLVGDPKREELIYTSAYRGNHLFPGKRLRFTFDDGDTQVYASAQLPQEGERYGLYVEHYNNTKPYAENQSDYVEEVERFVEYNVFYPLRQDIDYTIDYSDNSVVFQKLDETQEPVRDDPWLNSLAENAYMPEGMSSKIITKRFNPAHSAVGAEVTDKRITDNGFWQLYSIAIRAPISIKKWREAYKDFVHPAGMYLEGEIVIQSDIKLFGEQPSVILEEYREPVHSEDEILERMQASLTELNINYYNPTLRTFSQSGYVSNDRTPYSDIDPGGVDSANAPVYAEERMDSDRADYVYRSRINDIKEFSKKGFTLEQLDDQYQRMDRIDDIEPRRFDNVEADLSSTVNLMDENQWYATADIFCLDSDGQPQFTMLGNVLDFPREYGGCPGFHFNLFGLIRPLKGYSSTEGTPDGNNFNLVDGLAQQKITAYRDERVWGYTNDPGTRSPGQQTIYSDNVDSFGNQLGGTSRWDVGEDYANPFDYAITNGIARTIIQYFANAYIVDSGQPGYGDSADYMNELIKFDSTDGSTFFRYVLQDSV